MSSSQRLPNGNTFIAYGPEGRTIEVTSKGTIVWDEKKDEKKDD